MKFNVDSSGGGSAAFVAVPAAIRAGGAALVKTASQSQARRTYGSVGGCGDYAEVSSAVDELVGRWDPALDSWQRSLDSLGQATTQASRAITTNDENNAGAWSATTGGAR